MNESKTQQSPSKQNLSLLMILGALMAVTSLATDLYLPAMPQMQAELHGNVELTITGFLIGFALAQLIWGPVSDRIGRKKPLIVGMVLFIIGSAGCALSQSMGEIVFWRVFQALGACTGPMLARAMVRDMFAQSRAVQVLSTLTLVMAASPIIAPLIGGQLVRFGSWHWNFWLLTALSILLLIAVFRLPETLPGEQRSRQPLWQAFRSYAALLKNAAYMRYVWCVTFFYVATYAFITASPAVYIQHFGVEPQYFGLLFGLNIVGIMLTTALNKRLLKRFTLNQMLKAAALFAAASGLCLLAAVFADVGGLVAVVLFVFLFFSMTGIIAACCTAAALSQVATDSAGSASALLGSLQYGSGIVSSSLLALFSGSITLEMAGIIALFAGLSAVMAVWERG